jgi:hypothetical protein
VSDHRIYAFTTLSRRVVFGEDGVEAQEIPLGALVGGSKGQGKSDGMALAGPRRGQSFIGKTGFLAQGGH